MFTPPPSPDPGRARSSVEYRRELSHDSGVFLTPDAALHSLEETVAAPAQEAHLAKKRRIGRHTRWTVLLVPAVLILITLSTRWLAHPSILDAFSADSLNLDWERWRAAASDLTVHKRHPSPDPSGTTPPPISFPGGPSSPTPTPTPSPTPTFAPPPSSAQSGSSTSSASSSTASSTGVPTVPATPPVLPTPFPQPFSTLSNNFSTQQCEDFFLNMTQQESFRECRSFSMLLQSSSDFIEAQKNLTELNTIMWGTCNTPISEQQCIENMNGFASTLQSVCAEEMSQQNAMVEQTLLGLQSYDVLRQAGCLVDNNTDTYCYVSAVASPIPSDVYFYSLPLGIALPDNVKLSCSNCTQLVMNTFVQHSTNVTGLGSTYEPAAQTVDAACGSGFVDVGEFGEETSGAVLVEARACAGLLLASALAVLALTSW